MPQDTPAEPMQLEILSQQFAALEGLPDELRAELLKRFDKEVKNRHEREARDQEQEALDAEAARARDAKLIEIRSRGQVFGFSIAVMGIFAAVFAYLWSPEDAAVFGSVMGTVNTLGLVSVFVLSNRAPAKGPQLSGHLGSDSTAKDVAGKSAESVRPVALGEPGRVEGI